MRPAVRIGVLNLLVTFTLLGCAPEVPRVYERQMQIRELAADVGPVDNAFRLQVFEETRGRFACSLAIAKLVPNNEAGVVKLVKMTPAEEAWWVEAVRGITPLSDLQFLSPISVVPEKARTDTLCAAAADRAATLLMLYAPNRYGPNSAQVLGVIFDVASCQPIATLHSSANFILGEEGEEIPPEDEIGDHRDEDACFQALRTYEQHLLSCLGELIQHDSPSPTTQPHHWQTPPSQRWWLPRGHR